MAETTVITTHVRADIDDFDIRREFCGFQDKRLNELRQFTSCIIDLQTQGTKDPFEKVTWTISHYDASVRAFVVKRLQSWAQTTQIAAQMYKEDIAFRQQTCFDTSSSSNETKGQQLGHSSGKSSPSPPRMILKSCKTPSHEYHYGSVPNAALVPQTDLQPRNQQGRRRRNSSSSTNSSGTRRPALFGKPSDCFFSGHRYSSSSALTRADESKKLFNEDGLSLLKRSNTFDVYDGDFEDEAKWANLLSDCSDFEDDSQPLMGDVILVSQLRDCLVHASNVTIDNIHTFLSPNLTLTSNEQMKTLNNRSVWFHRLILNSKIILSNGIHPRRDQAGQLALKKVLELMTCKEGVEPKIVANGRCKIVRRKYLSPKRLNETTLLDSTINSTMNE